MKKKVPNGQLSLWDEPEHVIVWHHHIEVQYTDNTREIVCTHDATKPRKDNSYAAFVGQAMADECYICNAKKK